MNDLQRIESFTDIGKYGSNDFDRSDTFTEYNERSDTFTDFNNKESYHGDETNYGNRTAIPNYTNDSDSDSEVIDVERINWLKFFARIAAITLLVMILICVGLGAITPRFFVLAGIVSILLVLVLVLSFFDISCLWKRCTQKKTSGIASIDNPLIETTRTSLSSSIKKR